MRRPLQCLSGCPGQLLPRSQARAGRSHHHERLTGGAQQPQGYRARRLAQLRFGFLDKLGRTAPADLTSEDLEVGRYGADRGGQDEVHFVGPLGQQLVFLVSHDHTGERRSPPR